MALVAVFIAIAAMIAAAASADAHTGGLGDTGELGTEEAGGCTEHRLGKRTLRLGDCGTDVRTLNWVLRSKQVGGGLKITKRFAVPTDGAVRAFQRNRGLAADGVADRPTVKRLVGTMNRAVATWYGPGFWGSRTACGQRLGKGTVGVAHRKLRCGTRVVLERGGRFLLTRVIDRGPFANGASWDLTQRAARKLGLRQTDSVRAAALR